MKTDPKTTQGGHNPLHEIPQPVEIATFGGLSVCIDGQCIRVQEWKCRRVYQLLLVLVAHGGKNVSIEEVLDLIWFDAEGDKAMQNFEFTLRSLRKILQKEAADQVYGAKIVLLQHGKLSLNSDCCSLDIWKWEAHCKYAKEMRNNGNLAEAFSHEQSAANLIQGEFLAGEGDITLVQRESWRRLCTNWISHTAMLWMEHAQTAHVNVMPLLDRGMTLDPYSEKVCMQTMHALLNEGFTVDAIRVYRAWVKLIKHELNMIPSSKIGALYKSIAGRNCSVTRMTPSSSDAPGLYM